MTARLVALAVVVALIAAAAALGVRGPAPGRFDRCSSATIGTAACPGSTSSPPAPPAAPEENEMSFFGGVIDCNNENGGAHQFGEPQRRTLELTGDTSYAVSCGGCEVTAWGATPGQAMDRAQEVDRANRGGRLW